MSATRRSLLTAAAADPLLGVAACIDAAAEDAPPAGRIRHFPPAFVCRTG
jgi:hypothetical protein